MKKTYQAPAARIFNVKTTAMIAQSIKVDNENPVSASESLVNEERTETTSPTLWGNEW